jgi:hypothetical protein
MAGGSDDDDAWFEPKRRGYGFGLPVAWQGWALLAGLLVVAFGAIPLVQFSVVAYILIVAAANAAFFLIGARKTRGALKWRWGNRDKRP